MDNEIIYHPSPLEEAYGIHLLSTVFQVDASSSDGESAYFRVSGRDAVPFLSQSGLDRDVLRHIWSTVDPESTGRLTTAFQFYVILRLVALAQAGILVDALSAAAAAAVSAASGALSAYPAADLVGGGIGVAASDERITINQCLLRTANRTDLKFATFQGYPIPDDDALRSLYFLKKCTASPEPTINTTTVTTSEEQPAADAPSQSLVFGSASFRSPSFFETLASAESTIPSDDGIRASSVMAGTSVAPSLAFHHQQQLSIDDAFEGLIDVPDAPLPTLMNANTNIDSGMPGGGYATMDCTPENIMIGGVPSKGDVVINHDDDRTTAAAASTVPQGDVGAMQTTAAYHHHTPSLVGLVDSTAAAAESYSGFGSSSSSSLPLVQPSVDPLDAMRCNSIGSDPTFGGFGDITSSMTTTTNAFGAPSTALPVFAAAHSADDVFGTNHAAATVSASGDDFDDDDFGDFSTARPPVVVTTGAWDALDALATVQDAPVPSLAPAQQPLETEDGFGAFGRVADSADGVAPIPPPDDMLGGFAQHAPSLSFPVDNTVRTEPTPHASNEDGDADFNYFAEIVPNEPVAGEPISEGVWGAFDALALMEDAPLPTFQSLSLEVSPPQHIETELKPEESESEGFGDFVGTYDGTSVTNDDEQKQAEGRQMGVPVIGADDLCGGSSMQSIGPSVVESFDIFAADTHHLRHENIKLGLGALDALAGNHDAPPPSLGVISSDQHEEDDFCDFIGDEAAVSEVELFPRSSSGDGQEANRHTVAGESLFGALTKVSTVEVQSAGTKFNAGVSEVLESGWDALNALGEAKDAPLLGLTSLPFDNPAGGKVETSAPVAPGEVQSGIDEDFSDGFGDFVGGDGAGDDDGGADFGILSLDAAAIEVTMPNRGGDETAFDILGTSDDPLPSLNNPVEMDRVGSKNNSAHLKSISSDDFEDCVGFEDSLQNDPDLESTIENSDGVVNSVTVDERKDDAAVHFQAHPYQSSTTVESKTDDPFSAFDAAASPPVLLPSANSDLSTSPSVGLVMDAGVAKQFSSDHVTHDDDFGDFSGFQEGEAHDHVESTVLGPLTVIESKGEDSPANEGFDDFVAPSSQVDAFGYDEFGDFETVNYEDAIGSDPSGKAAIETASPDLANDSFGNFASFTDFGGAVFPEPDNAAVTSDVGGDRDRWSDLDEFHSPPSALPYGDFDEMSWDRDEIVRKSLELPEAIRRKAGAAGDCVDFGVCFDANIGMEHPLSEYHKNRILRCVQLLGMLSTSHANLASCYWSQCVSAAREELAKSVLFLKDATGLPKEDLDYVRSRLQVYLESLGECVRVSRNITASVGDLLMLDQSTMLTMDTFSSSWGSIALAYEALEVEALWKDVEALGSMLSLTPKNDTAHKLDSLVEIRSGHGPPTEFCNFTLQALWMPVGQTSTKASVIWAGKSYMACAANFLANNGAFYAVESSVRLYL